MKVPRKPASPGTLNPEAVVEAIRFFHLETSMYAYVPSRIGTNNAVDAAAQALVTAKSCLINPSDTLTRLADRQHGQALQLARTTFSVSEDTYMACALLLLFDVTVGKQDKRENIHARALPILLAQLGPDHCTDFRRQSFHSSCLWIFHCEIAHGLPHPFDDGRWEDVTWVSQTTTPSPEESRLRKATTRLLIRLPRLIALVRKVRQGCVEPLADEATRLALQLHALEDREAEAAILKSAKTVQTVADPDWKFVPSSYEYRCSQEWEAVVLYWSARLIHIRLCQTLAILFPAAAPVLRQASLRSTQVRMAADILMSWQYIGEQDKVGYGTRMKEASIIAWGGLCDMEVFEGMPVAALGEWIVWRLKQVGCKLDVQVMATYLDGLAGGPTEGIRRLQGDNLSY